MSDIATLSATEAARRVRAGALSAVELAEAMLERVAAREPVVRAFTHLDPALWRRQAAAVDAAVKAGRAGALAGLAFGVKDVLDTGDQPSQYGSPIWAGHRPRTDAACVALARRAGAVIAGKTVTTEFATRFPGPTTNPHDPAHTPGGSSQGSAAGVAAGMLHLAFGTQTAGSIIRPAAYCGAHGHKPTYGTVHRGGMKVMSESLDTIGVMARGFDDVALAMGAISAFDHGRPSERPDRAPRILVTPGVMPDALSPETRALLDRAAAACAARGATVQALDLPGECRRAQELHPVVMHGESAEALASERAMAAMLLSPGLREKLAWGEARGGAALAEARAAQRAAQRALGAALDGWDVILTSSAPGEAPRGLAETGDPVCNTLWTLAHLPSATFPAGRGPHGLPLGLQVVGHWGRDGTMLRWAAWIEAALG